MKISYLLISLVSVLAFVACEQAGTTDQPTPTVTATALPGATATATATTVPPTPTATPGFGMPKPPPATLTIAGQMQTSGIGTYCWKNASGVGLCADYVGIVTPKTPLVIQSPAKAAIRLPLTEAPTQFALEAQLVTQSDEMIGAKPDERIWNPVPGPDWQKISTKLVAEQEIELNLMPGLYVLKTFTVWSGYGDVSYGFLVEVK